MVLKEHLANKKILFLSVQTFNLEVEIKNKLEDIINMINFFRQSNTQYFTRLLNKL